MYNLPARLLISLVALLACLGLASAVSGSGSEGRMHGETKLPPTIEQTYDFLFSGRGPITVRDLQSWSGVTPRKVAATIYHWRLADDWLMTVTTTTEDGELITFWARKR